MQHQRPRKDDEETHLTNRRKLRSSHTQCHPAACEHESKLKLQAWIKKRRRTRHSRVAIYTKRIPITPQKHFPDVLILSSKRRRAGRSTTHFFSRVFLLGSLQHGDWIASPHQWCMYTYTNTEWQGVVSPQVASKQHQFSTQRLFSISRSHQYSAGVVSRWIFGTRWRAVRRLTGCGSYKSRRWRLPKTLIWLVVRPEKWWQESIMK